MKKIIVAIGAVTATGLVLLLVNIKEKMARDARHEACDYSVEIEKFPSSKKFWETMSDHCEFLKESSNSTKYAQEKLDCINFYYGEGPEPGTSYAEKEAQARYCARILAR